MKQFFKKYKIVIFLCSCILLICSCFTIVPNNYVGTVISFGIVETYTLEPGLHFKLPWQYIIKSIDQSQNETEIQYSISKNEQYYITNNSNSFIINKNDTTNVYVKIKQNNNLNTNLFQNNNLNTNLFQNNSFK